MQIDLAYVWAVVILFGIMMYVVMDGFDLGIGILFPWLPAKADRDVAMNTIAPVWDGNETWLVLGGAGLLAAFPLAYSVILTALYLPLVLMLVGLVFRGVAFEFRLKASERRRRWWDLGFSLGSAVAAFTQGIVLGAFVQGIPVRDAAYVGTPYGWLSAFSLFTGTSLVVAYALLGATWLVMRTEGELQAKMRSVSTSLAWGLLAVIGIVSLWTPLAEPEIARRWFSMPNLLWFSPVPLLVVLCGWRLLTSLANAGERTPFLLTLALVFLAYSGLGISLWPNIVPPSITVHEAAAPDSSLAFALVGALAIVPVILAYTAWSYWVFRGKVTTESGYH